MKKFFVGGVFIFSPPGRGVSPPAKGFFALRAHFAFGKSLFLSEQKK